MCKSILHVKNCAITPYNETKYLKKRLDKRVKREEGSANQQKLYEVTAPGYLYDKYVKEKSINELNINKEDLKQGKYAKNGTCLTCTIYS